MKQKRKIGCILQLIEKKTFMILLYLNPFVARHQDYYCLDSDEILMCADMMFEEL